MPVIFSLMETPCAQHAPGLCASSTCFEYIPIRDALKQIEERVQKTKLYFPLWSYWNNQERADCHIKLNYGSSIQAHWIVLEAGCDSLAKLRRKEGEPPLKRPRAEQPTGEEQRAESLLRKYVQREPEPAHAERAQWRLDLSSWPDDTVCLFLTLLYSVPSVLELRHLLDDVSLYRLLEVTQIANVLEAHSVLEHVLFEVCGRLEKDDKKDARRHAETVAVLVELLGNITHPRSYASLSEEHEEHAKLRRHMDKVMAAVYERNVHCVTARLVQEHLVMVRDHVPPQGDFKPKELAERVICRRRYGALETAALATELFLPGNAGVRPYFGATYHTGCCTTLAYGELGELLKTYGETIACVIYYVLWRTIGAFHHAPHRISYTHNMTHVFLLDWWPREKADFGVRWFLNTFMADHDWPFRRSALQAMQPLLASALPRALAEDTEYGNLFNLWHLFHSRLTLPDEKVRLVLYGCVLEHTAGAPTLPK